MKKLIAVFVLLLSLFASMDQASAYNPNAQELAVFQYTNELRAQYGRPPLRFSCILNDSARAKAQHMVDNGYFSHWYGSMTPETFKQAAGYPANSPGWGENILWGADSAWMAYEWWRDSSDHFENMLGTLYTEVGIGYVGSGAHYRDVYVMHFGNASTPTCADGGSGSPPSTDFENQAVDSVQFRTEPTTSAARIATLYAGDGYTATGEIRWADGYEWWQIETQHGLGWSASIYLAGYENGEPNDEGNETPAQADATTTTRVNLRAGPGLSYSILRTLDVGVGVTFIDWSNQSGGYSWVQVEALGIEGYIASEFLSWGSSPEPPTAPAVEGEWTTTANLRLRSSPSLSASAIATLPAGTSVTEVDQSARVTADGYTWAKLTTAYGTGWSATAFLQ
jgi:uncharacterized protein YraI